MASPTAAVLLIGDEILSGRTADANFNHIARRMGELGIAMKEARIIPDDEAEIIHAVKTLSGKYTYVFTTGGIGPTHDDITTESIAKAFGVSVVRRGEVVQALKTAMGERATEETFKMADFPENARLLETPITAAPGYIIGNVFVMAGIPRIMQAMLETAVPYLEKGEKIHQSSIDVFAGESQVSAGLRAVQDQFASVSLGSYPFTLEGKPGTSLVGRSTDSEALSSAMGEIRKMLDAMEASYR